MTGTGSYHDGPSFFFRGDTIYSYGQHFPIARHVTGTRGRAAVLFTTRDYSKTTSKHKGGPWDLQGFTVARDAHPQSRVIAQICGAETPEETKANARLIAAAPELLEAMFLLVSFADGTKRGNLVSLDFNGNVLKACRAAIAKAEAEGGAS